MKARVPIPSGIAAASLLLRIAIIIHAAATFLSVFTYQFTQFGTWLFMEAFHNLDDPASAAFYVERILVSIYLAAAVAVVFAPAWPLLILISGYIFMESYSGLRNTGHLFSEWMPAAYMLRYLTPWVLMVLTVGPRFEKTRAWTRPAAMGLLQLGIGGVFFVHGCLAWMEHPGFIDLIIGTFRNLFRIPMNESAAVTILKGIAVVDWVVALALLLYPNPPFAPDSFWNRFPKAAAARRRLVPPLLFWLAGWGLVTALSRLTGPGLPVGFSQYPALLTRASHYLGPLALYVLFILPGHRPHFSLNKPDSPHAPD
ncbi:MAG: hypothetical protein JJU05_08840 [Verrucomicrobia bacterium]|nr:hypothetical protein [Verrucomicrobiota bacterium]MCH8527004.1 hypothetical protein [Kiritimatiellia bacterium]